MNIYKVFSRKITQDSKPLLFVFLSGMELKTPFDVEKGPSGLQFTYLDTVGRPVIVAYKNNLVEQHIQDFEVSLYFVHVL